MAVLVASSGSDSSSLSSSLAGVESAHSLSFSSGSLSKRMVSPSLSMTISDEPSAALSSMIEAAIDWRKSVSHESRLEVMTR